jgi:hypothetical protein
MQVHVVPEPGRLGEPRHARLLGIEFPRVDIEHEWLPGDTIDGGQQFTRESDGIEPEVSTAPNW